MSSTIQNIVVALGVVLIAALGYYLYAQNSAAQLSNGEIDNQLALKADLFLTRLTELKQIRLDASLFSDSRFNNLVDFSEPISPQPVGRANPFVAN